VEKLGRAFYSRDSLSVAKALLGKVLVRETGGERIAARIVETEAYMGVTDRAAHSYGGRRTPRVEAMYGEAGFAYVFMIYGMHCCFNVVVAEKEIPQAVLIRGLEPLEGLEQMALARFGRLYDELTNSQGLGLTNGPGKLCRALGLDRRLNGVDLCGNMLYIEDGERTDFSVVTAKRVGVDYAGEAKDYPWRFYIKDNKYVSVR